MDKKIGVAVVVALVALGGAWYFWLSNRSAPIPPSLPTVAVRVPAPAVKAPPPPTEGASRYPMVAPATASALPELGHSDAAFLKALGDWLGHRALLLFFSDDVIRRIVMTVDNLPRGKLPPDAMPLKPVSGSIVTAGTGDSLVISRQNGLRYSPYIRLVRKVDAAKLVGIYGEFYPLFQRAYEELTNTRAYFNDRLVEAIDDMLAAPDPAALPKLSRKVDGRYEFADPDLAARSAGQKILLRMGAENAMVVKAKLRAIRQEITRGASSLKP